MSRLQVCSSIVEVRMRTSRRNDPAKVSDRPEVPRSRTDSRRRGFLLALGAGGAGAAVLAARSLTGVAPQGDAATPADDGQGYRATDHVKRYYQTTKI
jgi:hypothetical protein